VRKQELNTPVGTPEPSPTLSRRHFLARASAVGAGFAGLRLGFGDAFAPRRALASAWDASAASGAAGYGPLLADPDGILALPKGFSYSIVSPVGAVMDDGLLVPGKHDGMGAFAGPDGLTILVRNHEIEPAHVTTGPFDADPEPRAAGENRLSLDRLSLVPERSIYDLGADTNPSRGGTTTLVYDTRTRELKKHFLSLAGTERNCAGGITPRQSWITCEESVATTADGPFARDHGWCFEVPATAEPALAEPRPIVGMGRFNHEACCTDPVTGIVYLTEDRHDGLLYRFVPNDPADLHTGGRLQALKVLSKPGLDTRNWPKSRETGGQGPLVARGESLPCSWVTLDEVESPKDDLRYRGFEKGAARFARGEGMWWGVGSDGRPAAYFACTNGGEAMAGQIFRLIPSAQGTLDELELFIEPNDPGALQNADNITFAPWGDILVCEDGEAPQYLVGVTPKGECYAFARNDKSASEFAGATFSPDGSTLFVNMQAQGWTLAITGPWRRS
jgi:secreted PhoX family phosphatase